MKPWIAALAVAVSIFSPSLSGLQPSTRADSEYLTLLRQYASGRIRESVTALAAWPEDRVRTATRPLRAGVDRGLARTAVSFHTETAFVATRDRLASFHIGVAQSLLPEANVARDRTFATRWHGMAALLYAMRRNQVQARRHINLGIGLDGRSKDALLARGILEELSVRDVEHNLRGIWSTPASGTRLESRLTAAALAYQSALESDPQFAEARLRLGWVLSLNHSSDHARAELGQLVGPEARADVRHLAHLFLGAIADRDKRRDEAAREYAAAHAIFTAQTSFVALIQAEAILGHDDQVARVASAFAAHPPTGRDPWWEFSEGMTSGELVEWMRREAARP